MSSKLRPTRYAHIEGLPDICYSDTGRFIITCGQDGDVRLFEGLDDDDCKTHTVADKAHAVAYKDGTLLVGTDLNMVQTFTMDDGEASGIVTRFTDHPTHIDVYKDLIAVGSSDMTIKIHDSTNFKDTLFSGHEAPILSVAIDPNGDFLSSSSCDGTVRIWNVRTQTIVRNFPLLEKKNSISSSHSLCRMKWAQDGMLLYVPVGSEVHVYDRTKWKVAFVLKMPDTNEFASVLSLSHCEGFLACGGGKGTIAVFDLKQRKLVLSETLKRSFHITGIAWHPIKDHVAFVNSGGEMGTLENFLVDIHSAVDVERKTDQSTTAELEYPFVDEDVDEDDNDISIAKIKSQLGFADDEEGTYLGLHGEKEDSSKPTTPAPTPQPPQPIVQEYRLPEPQKPFQPGMSPEHLNDRYMMWNNTGIVRQYTSDDENSIEVEFHDSSVHHALHLNNHFGHSIAQLNTQMLALGAESQDDQLSKLVVHHFSAWDGSREWQTDMPEGEDISAITVGDGWVAVATDTRNIRIFSSAGVQRDLFSIPGPVVCLSSFEEFIFIVYHAGLGVRGEQSLSAMVLNIRGRNHLLSNPTAIPLSPNAYLSWGGFTDEGTPIIMDSTGLIRILRTDMAMCWTQILNTKMHAKGKSDNYFIIGASETQNTIRCILCKGSRYPPVLPRPHVSMLELKVPVCESESEKSILEEQRIRGSLVSSMYGRMEKKGYDVEIPKTDNIKAMSEALIKLFALSCRSDRESRALEVCQLMPNSHAIQLAIKYASKLHKSQLSERLAQLVEEKVDEELRQHNEENEEPNYSRFESQSSRYEDSSPVYETATVDSDKEDEIDGDKVDNVSENPLLLASKRQEKVSTEKCDQLPLTPATRNPFKKANNNSGERGLKVIDAFKVTTKKQDSAPILRPVVRMGKSKQPAVTFSPQPTGGKENQTTNIKRAQNPFSLGAKTSKVSALKLWMDDNIEMVKENFPDVTDAELLGKAALLFKDVEDSTKQKYKELSANGGVEKDSAKNCEEITSVGQENKRKLDATNGSPVEKKIKSDSSRLSAFAFVKKS